MEKTDHYIPDLHAGVVNVILYVDFLLGGAKQADESISKDGVAEMADVSGFVGVDAGVFDEGMDAGGGTDALGIEECADGSGAVEVSVDVTGAGDFKAGKAL